MDIVLLIVAWIAVLMGMGGIFLPMMPGVPLIWMGILIIGWMTGFEALSGAVVAATGVIMILSQGVDYVAGTIGAKALGATPMGTMGAFIGVIVGLLTLGALGVIIGPFIGALLAELMAGRTEWQAIRSGMGTFIGFLGGTFVQMLVGIVLFGYFIIGFVRYFSIG